MGWERKTITVTGYVSRHNSFRDRVTDALWDELVLRVKTTVAEFDLEVEQLTLRLEVEPDG